VTEFGAEATLDGPADRKQTYAFQADYVKQVLGIVARDPNISGAIYWTLREFAVKPYWDGGAEIASIRTDAIHNKGLISYDGRRVKPAFDVAAREFAATPLYRTAPTSAPAARPADPLGWVLALSVPLGILAMLLLSGWALRDIWRSTRPPEAQVLALPRRHAA
jgi:beta-glucuronidase